MIVLENGLLIDTKLRSNEMTRETKTTKLTYFFKKSLCGMVLHIRVADKEDERNSQVIKCDEEQATNFLLWLKEQ